MKNILSYFKKAQAKDDILDQSMPNLEINIDELNPTRKELFLKLLEIQSECSQVSGFTLTFRKKFHDIDDKQLHREVQKELTKSRLWKNTNYIIIPEFTRKGQLHYHGIMYNQYQIVVMRCIKWWRRKYGFVKPELELKSKRNWIKYMMKDYGKTGLWTIYEIKVCK